MGFFHDPFIDLWMDMSLMITGEESCRVWKRKIYASITLEVYAKVPKNVSQITGFSSSRVGPIFAKLLGGKENLVSSTIIFFQRGNQICQSNLTCISLVTKTPVERHILFHWKVTVVNTDPLGKGPLFKSDGFLPAGGSSLQWVIWIVLTYYFIMWLSFFLSYTFQKAQKWKKIFFWGYWGYWAAPRSLEPHLFMLNEPHSLGVPSQEPPVPNWKPDLARCSWRACVNLSVLFFTLSMFSTTT